MVNVNTRPRTIIKSIWLPWLVVSKYEKISIQNWETYTHTRVEYITIQRHVFATRGRIRFQKSKNLNWGALLQWVYSSIHLQFGMHASNSSFLFLIASNFILVTSTLLSLAGYNSHAYSFSCAVTIQLACFLKTNHA